MYCDISDIVILCKICPSYSFSANIFLEICQSLSLKKGFRLIGKEGTSCHTATNIPGLYTEINTNIHRLRKRELKHAKWLSNESHLCRSSLSPFSQSLLWRAILTLFFS